MAERQVTIDGKPRMLPNPFFVLATQNPLEMEGTYPLPEAQLDRFLYKILVTTPSREELVDIIDLAAKPPAAVSHEPVTNAEQMASFVALARDVVLTRDVRDLIARMVLATHRDNEFAPEPVRLYVRHGASPRAALAIAMGLKARALMEGRAHAERSDIPKLFKPALRHRISLNFEGEAEGLDTDDVLQAVLEAVPLR
jgi:MoxR-like ATPase